MDDLNNPRISAYKPQRRLLLPKPPGYRPKLSAAERKRKAQAQQRANARAKRLHLVGVTNAAVVGMGVLAGAMIVLLVVLLFVSHD